MTTKPKLFIIRGLPGSGKTNFAKMFPCLHVDPLMFYQKSGQFEYDNQLIHYAHGFCKDLVHKCMREGVDVVVTNSFVQNWELSWYRDKAEEVGYDIVIYTMPHTNSCYTIVPQDYIKYLERIWEPVEGEVFVL